MLLLPLRFHQYWFTHGSLRRTVVSLTEAEKGMEEKVTIGSFHFRFR